MKLKKNIAKNNNQNNKNQIWHKKLIASFFLIWREWGVETNERREKGERKKKKKVVGSTPDLSQLHALPQRKAPPRWFKWHCWKTFRSLVKGPSHAGTCITHINNSFPMVYDFSRKGAENFVWVSIWPLNFILFWMN